MHVHAAESRTTEAAPGCTMIKTTEVLGEAVRWKKTRRRAGSEGTCGEVCQDNVWVGVLSLGAPGLDQDGGGIGCLMDWECGRFRAPPRALASPTRESGLPCAPGPSAHRHGAAPTAVSPTAKCQGFRCHRKPAWTSL